MRYGLRDGVSFCFAGDRFFFLDRPTNRYVALRPSDQQRFTALVEAGGNAGQQDVPPALARLICAGSTNALEPFALAPVADSDLDVRGSGTVSPLLSALGLWSFASMKIRTTRMKKAGAFDGGAPAQAWPFALHPSPLADLTRAFERIRSWTGEDQCLPLSLAYACLARSMGHEVEVVFGITPRPFGAHCWVQQGSIVLNDRLGRIETFTPIYAS